MVLEEMGADAVGANCSLGPKQLRSVAKELLENASIPVASVRMYDAIAQVIPAIIPAVIICFLPLCSYILL